MDGLGLMMNVPSPSPVPAAGMSPTSPSHVWAIGRGFSLFPQLPPRPAQRRRGEQSPPCPNPLRRFQASILFIKSRGCWSLKVHGREETGYEPLRASGCRTQTPERRRGCEGRRGKGRGAPPLPRQAVPCPPVLCPPARSLGNGGAGTLRRGRAGHG